MKRIRELTNGSNKKERLLVVGAKADDDESIAENESETAKSRAVTPLQVQTKTEKSAEKTNFNTGSVKLQNLKKSKRANKVFALQIWDSICESQAKVVSFFIRPHWPSQYAFRDREHPALCYQGRMSSASSELARGRIPSLSPSPSLPPSLRLSFAACVFHRESCADYST